MLIDENFIPIMAMAIVPITAIGWPLARAYAKRIAQGDVAGRVPPDVAARLERMEQAIDSIAVEVERISEGQRFTAKLLSERTAASSEPGGVPPGRG
jgi:hypothetical protein